MTYNDEKSVLDVTKEIVDDLNTLKGYAMGKLVAESSIGNTNPDDVAAFLTSIKVFESFNELIVKSAEQMVVIEENSKKLVKQNDELMKKLGYLMTTNEGLSRKIDNLVKKEVKA